MHAGFDIQGGFWLVVIVASIIGQMMKAAKKHHDAAPGTPQAPRPERPAGGGAPAEELEEFLRNLMGGQAPRREPPPLETPAPPVPLAQEPPRRNKPLLQHRSTTAKAPVVQRSAVTVHPPKARHPEKRIYRATPAVPPPAPSPTPARIAMERGAAALPTPPVAAIASKSAAALTAEVHRQVKTPESLRAALLLREVLGPPIALRGMNQIP